MAFRYRIKPEESEQITALEWLRLSHPDIAKDAIHIANERKTSPMYGYTLKQMGVRPGIPDLFWPKPIQHTHTFYHGLFIEVKTAKGRLTSIQQETIDQLNEDGYYACVAYGARNIIVEVYYYFQL